MVAGSRVLAPMDDFPMAAFSARSLESRPYDFLCCFVLVTLYWLVALCWIQFIQVWLKLRKWLESLEIHPLREAFSRLEKQVNWVPLVTNPPSHTLLITS